MRTNDLLTITSEVLHDHWENSAASVFKTQGSKGNQSK